MTIFAKLGLNATIQKNIAELGYKNPTDIQELSIGAVLSGADTYAIAPTGTGKTAAYLLPLLQELSQDDHSDDQVRPIRGLFLVPTRELAQQVEESIQVYGKGLKLRTITLFGGVRVESQTKRFKRGADIIVSTPKRLVDLLKLKTFSLAQIQHFVMDEADRLVSMGIQNELNFILSALPKKKQMVLFSATDSKSLVKFGQQHLQNKKVVKSENSQPALDKIVHTLYRTLPENKTEDLISLLDMLNCDRALVFARTKSDVNRLTERLNQRGLSSEGIHNEIPQKKRKERLDGFKNKSFKFLIATDIASRGIDVDDLYYVINFDLPVNSTDYIHRAGRTARTGTSVESNSMSTVAIKHSSKVNVRKSDSSDTQSPNKITRRERSAMPYVQKTKVTGILGHVISLVSFDQERLVDAISKTIGKELTIERSPFHR